MYKILFDGFFIGALSLSFNTLTIVKPCFLFGEKRARKACRFIKNKRYTP
jgi:hypothetical protein